MAKQTNDYKPTGFRIESVVFTDSDGTTTKPIVVADFDDSVIVQLSAATESSNDETIRFYLYDGSTDFFLTDVVIPAGSGVGITPSFDILALPFIYNASLPIQADWSLRGSATTTVNSDVTITAIITDY